MEEQRSKGHEIINKLERGSEANRHQPRPIHNIVIFYYVLMTIM